MDSAVMLEMIPAKIAIIPFQKVVMEKVMPIHSEGKPWRSECSYTYLAVVRRGWGQGDRPGLKGGEEHGSGDPSEHPTDQEPPEVRAHLGQAAEGVDD